MATILAKIKSRIRNGEFNIGFHCLKELADDDFTVADALHAIKTATDVERLTDDPAMIRYVLFGQALDDKAIEYCCIFRERKCYTQNSI